MDASPETLGHRFPYKVIEENAERLVLEVDSKLNLTGLFTGFNYQPTMISSRRVMGMAILNGLICGCGTLLCPSKFLPQAPTMTATPVPQVQMQKEQEWIPTHTYTFDHSIFPRIRVYTVATGTTTEVQLRDTNPAKISEASGGTSKIILKTADGRHPVEFTGYSDCYWYEEKHDLIDKINAWWKQMAQVKSGGTSSAGGGSVTDELVKLRALKDDGGITAEEYEQLKAKLLAS